MSKLSSTLGITWGQFSRSQKVGTTTSLFLRIFVAFLDLAGIAVVGAIASVLSGPKNYENLLPQFLDDFFRDVPPTTTIAILIALAVTLFTLKSAVSYLLARRVNNFMAKVEANKAAGLFQKILKSDLSQINRWPKQEVVFGLSESVSAAFTKLYTAGMVIIVEFSMIFAIAIYLYLINPILLFGATVFFLVIFLVINLTSGRITSKYAQEGMRSSINSNKKILEAIENFKQFRVSNKNQSLVDSYTSYKNHATAADAKIVNQNSLQRYLVEGTLVIALGVLIILIQTNPEFSISAETFAIFAAGSFRILSSVIPIQTNLNRLREALVDSEIATAMITSFDAKQDRISATSSSAATISKDAAVEFCNVSFHYQAAGAVAEEQVIRDSSFQLTSPGFVAVSGRSGEGKTTLVDLMLGILKPSQGEVYLFGESPTKYIEDHPGAIAYVPQQPSLIEGTIWQNITLGDKDSIDTDALQNALKAAALQDFVSSLPLGIETVISGNGVTLSGGQAQRISIARAIYQRPKLLVLDEATNALDLETENVIKDTLATLSKTALVIVISHSSNTLAPATRTILVEGHQVVA